MNDVAMAREKDKELDRMLGRMVRLAMKHHANSDMDGTPDEQVHAHYYNLIVTIVNRVAKQHSFTTAMNNADQHVIWLSEIAELLEETKALRNKF